jgi:hypothetical protein
MMSTIAQQPATTPIPVQLSESEFEAFILPHLSMPKRGPKCKLGYYPAIPANGPDILCDDDVGAICWRFDLNLTLMSISKRPHLSAGRAENPPQASSGHTTPRRMAIAEWFP